ncbi:MAG: phosphoenolpyruvate--protein phosphotransferase [Treponema sp.]|jgi:phosphotransferase system enzyme I (PtsI)|nr:phosphoenolpyruvate--protein phosphotransferase [Treponema sp.]
MKTLFGIPASQGIVIGKAFVYVENDFPEIPRYSIKKPQAEQELKRLENAIRDAMDDVRQLQERAVQEMSRDQAAIFEAHLMMLDDPDFQDQIKNRIETTLQNAEWVVFDTVRDIMKKMMESPDPLFRERAADINDVSKRVLDKLLSIKRVSLAVLERDIILVAHDLLPSEVLTMNKERVKGIVMDMGSNTSHTAILARAFNIPAVLGLSVATQEISSDNLLVIDGAAGTVYVDPEKKDLARYEQATVQYRKKLGEFLSTRDLPAETRDGYRVVLNANIEIPEEADEVSKFGAEGIGLYRSEFLFLNPGQTAEEEDQFQAYSRVLKAMRNKPVTIRTVDIGGDKIIRDFKVTADEKNPLLGWRAIRFSLAQPELFKTQLRAILRASVYGNVRIMFPLISGIEELEQARTRLEEAKDECRAKGQAFADAIKVGTMIEVPSAAMIADILARYSDFFSIGTNDLIQYSLAVDRGNERVSYLAQPFHPAVLRLIKKTIDAAHDADIKAAMCGELAGDPAAAAVLLGLGLDEFSMAASSIPHVKRIIRRATLHNCRDLAGELLRGTSATANAGLVKKWMAANFPEQTDGI